MIIDYLKVKKNRSNNLQTPEIAWANRKNINNIARHQQNNRVVA
jgi:hypothetical protein